jgi:hypothetical protein
LWLINIKRFTNIIEHFSYGRLQIYRRPIWKSE